MASTIQIIKDICTDSDITIRLNYETTKSWIRNQALFNSFEKKTMKQISSNFTPLLKYIFPWTIIIMLTIGTIAAFIDSQFGLAFGIVIMGTVVVGFMRTMLMDLKKVFLDKENKLLIVKGSTEESIPYNDIKEILKPWTPPYIATVQLTKHYSFGNTFVFIPEGHPMSWGNYDEDLKSKIRK